MESGDLERSLDEIIGDRPSNSRRGSGRFGRGGRQNNRKTPYARDSRDAPRPRDGPRRGSPDADRKWSHDRYEDRRPSRGQGRATCLRVSNIHYDLTEDEVRSLFDRIAPVARFSMRYDRAGRSEGVAFVTYDRYGDAKAAIAEYDGKRALGQSLEVELDSVVPPPTKQAPVRDLASRLGDLPPHSREQRSDQGSKSRGGRGGRAGARGGREKRAPLTADALDAELESYLNQRNDGDAQKVADAGAGGEGGTDGMQID